MSFSRFLYVNRPQIVLSGPHFSTRSQTTPPPRYVRNDFESSGWFCWCHMYSYVLSIAVWMPHGRFFYINMVRLVVSGPGSWSGFSLSWQTFKTIWRVPISVLLYNLLMLCVIECCLNVLIGKSSMSIGFEMYSSCYRWQKRLWFSIIDVLFRRLLWPLRTRVRERLKPMMLSIFNSYSYHIHVLSPPLKQGMRVQRQISLSVASRRLHGTPSGVMEHSMWNSIHGYPRKTPWRETLVWTPCLPVRHVGVHKVRKYEKKILEWTRP